MLPEIEQTEKASQYNKAWSSRHAERERERVSISISNNILKIYQNSKKGYVL